MAKSISMKLGLFSWYGYKAPLEYRMKRVRQAGFDSTMLWRGTRESGDYPYSEEVKTAAEQLCLSIENVHLPFDNANDLWSDAGSVGQEYHLRLTNEISNCKKYGIPTIVIHISEGTLIEKPTTIGIDTMQSVVDSAASNGVTIAVENTQRINLIEALLENVKSDYFGLCYDTSHGNLYEPNEFYLLKKYPDRLKCLQISDNDGIEDKHWNIEEGQINWKHFVECFPVECYRKTFSLEVYPKVTGDSEEAHLLSAFRSLAKLRDWIASRSI